MFLIELKQLTKTYHTAQITQPVLKQVDLQIRPGELMAIIGDSGSGKSTLMNILGLLDSGTSGDYIFEGRPMAALTQEARAEIRNQKMGFVFQSFFLLARMTALQNVMLPILYQPHYNHLLRKTMHARALQLLDRVGIAHLAQHKPNQLSGGQQQRVAIARALICNPSIIFADEPTGALDSKTGNEVMNLFLDLHREKQCTIVLITHNKEISEQCPRVISIKDGKVVEK